MTPQQQRMSDCSKQASDKGMKGDDRNAFMSTCLKGGGDKTAACNTQADEKKLHGAARDSFVKKCARRVDRRPCRRSRLTAADRGLTVRRRGPPARASRFFP